MNAVMAPVAALFRDGEGWAVLSWRASAPGSAP
jgi:hypothetical protein